MKVTVEIKDDIYKELEKLTKTDKCSIDSEVEKAVVILTQKRALVQRLMNETCNEFNDAMRKLGD